MLFSSFALKSVVFPNRIVMPAMCQYSAGEDGRALEWHFVHYGSRAVGRTGCIIMEATAVEPRGRISRQDLGLWDDSQIEPLRRIVDFCRRHGTVMGIQLAHAGRKACGPELAAPSALPAGPDKPVPQALSKAEIQQIVDLWGQAAGRAAAAGFDFVQIHGAHGYLIHEFLSPLSNTRDDEYGGDLNGRMRFLLEVVEAVKANWPGDRPLSVRLSAVDYIDGGLTVQDTIAIARQTSGGGSGSDRCEFRRPAADIDHGGARVPGSLCRSCSSERGHSDHSRGAYHLRGACRGNLGQRQSGFCRPWPGTPAQSVLAASSYARSSPELA